MSARNKYLVNTLRTLFGLFMLFSGVSGLWLAYTGSMEGMPEAMIPVVEGLKDNGIFYMIKITEAVAGLMLALNLLPALGVIFLAPIAVGIIVFNSFVAPQYVISGVIVALLEIYFGYVYWAKYKALFTR
ncbi:MAG: hypothetical protein AAB373_03255 [Patescibacteria group bacterium]